MAKLFRVTSPTGDGLGYYCPGCKLTHIFRVSRGLAWNGEPVWTWNGDIDRPTFSPSMGCNMGTEIQCHSFVRDGKIEYLSDSRHELAGQTIEMLEEAA